MNTKLTPGPWSWEEQQGTDMPRLLGADGAPICDFGSCRDYYPTEGTPPDDAEARLIAAAPELLVACTSMLAAHAEYIKAYPSVTEEAECIGLARAAIAKATGAA